MKRSLEVSNFLEEISSLSILLFSSISLHWLPREAFLSLLAILWNSAFRWINLSFSPWPFATLFSQLFVRIPQTTIFPFCISFSWGWNQPYIYVHPFFGFLSHLSHHRALSGAPCVSSLVSPVTCFTYSCLAAKLCPALCNSMDYIPPGSLVRGISQARILEWVAISFSRGSSQPRDQTHISCINRKIPYCGATREPHFAHSRVYMSIPISPWYPHLVSPLQAMPQILPSVTSL